MNKTPSLVLSFLNCRRMMYATVPGLALTSCMLVDNAIAQITVDGTTSTTITPTENSIRIEGGDTAGSNLFHSFQDFSVTNGTEAFFNNGSNIENIFSRVTGGNVSNIDGLIRANNANLFLINPTGILFGAGASLDLGGGSFYGSTADSILFPEGEFNATENPSEPILIVNAPIGLRFRDEPASIEVVNADNPALSNENLTLLGGDISIRGRLSGSKINLGGLGEAGIINLAENKTVNFPENITKSDILLDGERIVVSDSNEPGLLEIQGNNLTLNNGRIIVNGETGLNITLDNSLLLENDGRIVGRVGNDLGLQGGTININGGNKVTLNNSRIISDLTSNASGNGADIRITAKEISLADSTIFSVTNGRGNSGNIDIVSSDIIEVSDSFIINRLVSSNGNSGDIKLTGKNIAVSGNSEIQIRIEENAVGDSGNIIFETENLLLKDRGSIVADNFGTGDQGNIIINASESIILDNDLSQLAEDEIELAITSRIRNILQETGTGSGGDVIINTKDFDLRNRSRIFVETQGFGDAGKLTINADNKVSLTGISEISSSAINIKSQGKGDAGDIEINTQVLEIDDGSIFSFLQGNGNAGNITINAIERVTLDALNDRGFATTQLNTAVLFDRESGTISRGNGGDIEVNTKNLDLKNGAAITANTLGEGDGGNIFINATETVNLTEGSIIRNDIGEIAIGDGGSIRIDKYLSKINCIFCSKIF